MKKLVIMLILLALTATAGAYSFGSLVTFVPIDEGDPGSLSNPLHVGDFADVYITVDQLFFSMNVTVLVDGPSAVMFATGKAEGDTFGWSFGPSNDPIIQPGLVEVGLAVEFDPKPAGLAAMITLQATGAGTVVLELLPGMNFEPSMDGFFKDPTVLGELTIYQAAPEPTTIGILGLGFLLMRYKRKRN